MGVGRGTVRWRRSAAGVFRVTACAAVSLNVTLLWATQAQAATRSTEQVSGAAAAGAYTDFGGASADGRHAIFVTSKQLDPADTDSQIDVYDSFNGVKTLVSIGPNGGNGPHAASFDFVSQDGATVVFETSEQLGPTDSDASRDVYQRSAGTTTLVSKGPGGASGAWDGFYEGSSADATRVFFGTNESQLSQDTDSFFDSYMRASGTATQITTGSSGGNGSFPAEFAGASRDGTHVFFETNEPLVAADTDSQIDVYERTGSTTSLVSTGPNGGNGSFAANYEGCSEDGTKVFFSTGESLISADTDAAPDVYRRQGGSTFAATPVTVATSQELVGVSADGNHVYFQSQARETTSDHDSFIDVYDSNNGAVSLVSAGLQDNQGATNTYFAGNAADGSHVFIRTEEPDAPADTDITQDIYDVSGGAVTLASVGPAGGNAAVSALYAGSSRDGSRLFFETYESLVSADTDARIDIYERSGGATTLLTSGATGGNGALDARWRGMTPNGERIFFRTSESLVAADSDALPDVYSSSLPGQVVVVKDAVPDDPQDFSFTVGGGLTLGLGAPPGQTTFSLDDDSDPTLSSTRTFADVPAGSDYSVTETVPTGWDQSATTCSNGNSPSNITVTAGQTVTCTFTNRKRGQIVVVKDAIPNDSQDFSFTAGGGLSPTSFLLDDDSDGVLSNTRTFTNVVPQGGYSLSEAVPTTWAQDSASCSDGSPPTNINVSAGESVTCTFVNVHGFPRPKGATPVRAALVPAYAGCVSPNTTHGGPLNSPSCKPPVPASTYLTTGSPDSNGAAANMNGSLRASVVPGNLNTPADEADVQLTASISDVRNRVDLTDYTGGVGAVLNVRLTDRFNGPGFNEPGTVADFPFRFTIPCASTTSGTVGSTCSASTSTDAITPGTVLEGRRALWQLSDAQVFDGGADGNPSTLDNTLFLRQGVFAP